jgi:SAM-dependent methyltransferase
MLETARTRTAANSVGIQYAKMDMRDFELGTLFDGVVIAANSLLHLHTAEDFGQAFAAIRRHLAPGGLLAFDVFVPSAYLLSLPPTDRNLVGMFTHPELGEVSVQETIASDPVTPVSQADWYWSIPAQPDFRCTTVHMRQLYPQEPGDQRRQ